MRRELSWALAVVVAFTIGASCARSYAQLAAPYYRAVAVLIADWHAWKIVEVGVAQDKASHSAVLRLIGEVRQQRQDRYPAATVVTSVQMGEVVQTPLVFWTLVLMWPAGSAGQRMWRIVAAIPLFLVLEATTTACQLLHSLAEASALLAGEYNPITIWDLWSRFLEIGGCFVIEVAAALAVVSMGSRMRTDGPRAGLSDRTEIPQARSLRA